METGSIPSYSKHWIMELSQRKADSINFLGYFIHHTHEPSYIFALISAANAFNASISDFCCGQPILIPSSAFGFGI
jgi:hypothetical protein